MTLDLNGTITVGNAQARSDLADSMRDAGCDVHVRGAATVDFTFEWGSPETEGSLVHAWQEIVFFLNAWQTDHAGVECRIRDLRFTQSGDRVPQTYAA
jgi:hypothetical protein